MNGGGIIMMFCSDKERDFFNNWFFHAQQDSNYDPEKQFFYFYALFDHLFKSYTKEKKNVLEKQGLNIKKGEKYKMLFFLYSILFYEEEKEYFEDFNPFATLKSKNETYLLKKIKIYESKVFFQNHSLPDFSMIEKLFTEIYKIRCELFHGDTLLTDTNKRMEIEEANIVLKEFLNRLLQANISETNQGVCK